MRIRCLKERISARPEAWRTRTNQDWGLGLHQTLFGSSVTSSYYDPCGVVNIELVVAKAEQQPARSHMLVCRFVTAYGMLCLRSRRTRTRGTAQTRVGLFAQ